MKSVISYTSYCLRSSSLHLRFLIPDCPTNYNTDYCSGQFPLPPVLHRKTPFIYTYMITAFFYRSTSYSGRFCAFLVNIISHILQMYLPAIKLPKKYSGDSLPTVSSRTIPLGTSLLPASPSPNHPERTHRHHLLPQRLPP